MIIIYLKKVREIIYQKPDSTFIKNGVTMIEKPPVVSMEDGLTSMWEARLSEAEDTIEQAKYNLGRISLIYSGQLMFDFAGNPGNYTSDSDGRSTA